MEGTSMYSILKTLFTDSVTNGTVNQMTGICVMLGLAIATILYFINLGQNYLKSSIGAIKEQSSNSYVDYGELARTLVIIAIIVLYLPLINVTTSTIDYLNRFTAVGEKEYAIMEKFAETYTQDRKVFQYEITNEVLQQTIDSQDPNINSATKQIAQEELNKRPDNDKTTESNENKEEGDSGIISLLKKMFNFLTNLDKLIGGIFYALGMVILVPLKLIIVSITLVIWRVMIIVGPLALAFSVLPAFKTTINTWAATYLNVGFVFTTLNIIDALMIKSIQLSFSNLTEYDGGGASYHIAIVSTFTYIILYLSSFWLTSKYVGKGDGGLPITKLVGIAAAAAAVAITGGAAAAGMAGGKAGNVGSALNTATDITKND